MKDSKYLYRDFYDGIIHILIMCLPIIVGTMNELLSQENGIIPVSLTIAISGQMYSVKEIWKDERFSNSIRIKIEMLVALLLLAVSLIYTAVIFTLVQVSAGEASSEMFKNAVVEDSAGKHFWSTYTVPTILYGISVIPYVVEVVFVLINEFKKLNKLKKCASKIALVSQELRDRVNLTSANIN